MIRIIKRNYISFLDIIIKTLIYFKSNLNLLITKLSNHINNINLKDKGKYVSMWKYLKLEKLYSGEKKK